MPLSKYGGQTRKLRGFFYPIFMATFRKIHVSFWSDTFVQELTPEQKYFFLYLLTNERTKMCGIYEVTKRQIAFDTGYNIETVGKLLAFFEEKGKVIYNNETNEILIRNWTKYNDIKGPKVAACVNKELQDVKDGSLLDVVGFSAPIGNGNYNKNYRVNPTLRKEIFAKSDNKCEKCGNDKEAELTIDHIIPRSMGGLSIPENLRCLCQSCNSARPVIGQELIDDVSESGYDYDQLCHLMQIKAYAYSMRSVISNGSQRIEKEKEEEKAKEQEAAVFGKVFAEIQKQTPSGNWHWQHGLAKRILAKHNFRSINDVSRLVAKWIDNEKV